MTNEHEQEQPKRASTYPPLEPSLLGRPMLDHAAPWSVFPFTVIDFETDGADPLACAPVSVACVRFEHGVPVRQFYSLLNPGRPIPAEASAIHGITDEQVKDAPTLADVAAGMFPCLEGALPVAYNAAFDRTIMHRFISGTDCPAWDPLQQWLCGLVVVRDIDKYVSGTGRHKLEHVCKRYGIELENAHNALADCYACGRLIVELKQLGKLSAECSLGRLLEHVERRRAAQDAEFAAYRARKEREAAQAAPPAEQQKLAVE